MFTYRLTLCLLALAALTGHPRAAVSAATALITEHAIFLADDGVARHDRASAAGSWQALTGRSISGISPIARELVVGAYDGIHVIDIDTGAPRWHQATHAPAFAPIVHGGHVYAATRGGAVLAVELATGTRIWEHQFTGWLYPPAVVGDHVIVGGSGARLAGIDLQSGTLRWERSVDQELVYRPVRVAPDRVVITTFAGTVTALSGTGMTAWTARDPAPSLSPTVAGAALVFAGLDGVLRVRSTSNGRLMWRRKVSDRFVLAPAVAGQTTVIVHDKTVTALDIATGRLVSTQTLPFAPSRAPAVADRRFVLFAPDGQPLFFDPRQPRG